MKKHIILLTVLALASTVTIQSCATSNPSQTAALESTGAGSASETNGETGTLQIRANGEDFVRKGFTSKDGWQISFDHVYVSLADVTAYQTDPPFDPESDGELQPKATAKVEGVKTVDLAAGDEKAEPILVDEIEAPAGRYNAIAWKMVDGTTGTAAEAPIVMQGVATKGGETVNFTLKLDQPIAFTCGDFVGDERKGILTAGNAADLEATFHFDHVFGDAETPANDSLNTGALGFDPLAAIAQNGELDADLATLKQNLSSADYEKLLAIVPSLGHAGEGHCKETPSS